RSTSAGASTCRAVRPSASWPSGSRRRPAPAPAAPPDAMNTSAPVVAVVGATGAAGGTVLRVLEERGFRHAELRLLASERSLGRVIPWNGRELTVRAVSADTLAGVDVAFFAAGALTSRRHAPEVAAGGGCAVDKSSAYRLDPGVPLVVPAV